MHAPIFSQKTEWTEKTDQKDCSFHVDQTVLWALKPSKSGVDITVYGFRSRILYVGSKELTNNKGKGQKLGRFRTFAISGSDSGSDRYRGALWHIVARRGASWRIAGN